MNPIELHLNDETIIWKYLDLSKFLDLIISRKINTKALLANPLSRK